MGKKQVLIVEYDVESGVLDVKYYGLTLRSEAKRILMKLHQNLMRSLMGGGFEPEQLLEEEIEDGKRESECKPECPECESGHGESESGCKSTESTEDRPEAGVDGEESPGRKSTE